MMYEIKIDDEDAWLLLYALKEITSRDGVKKLLKYHPHANLEDFEKHVEKMVIKLLVKINE